MSPPFDLDVRDADYRKTGGFNQMSKRATRLSKRERTVHDNEIPGMGMATFRSLDDALVGVEAWARARHRDGNKLDELLAIVDAKKPAQVIASFGNRSTLRKFLPADHAKFVDEATALNTLCVLVGGDKRGARRLALSLSSILENPSDGR